MDDIMSYIVHSYLCGIALICVGAYLFIDTIKNPIPNNRTSPLQENISGIAGGITLFGCGVTIIIAKLFYGW